jgi:hypothetical protein
VSCLKALLCKHHKAHAYAGATCFLTVCC